MSKCHSIDSIRCSPATRRQDLRAAFELIYAKYLATGLTHTNPTHMRIAEYQLSEQCEIIVAKHNDRVVGTISLVGETSNRLPLDSAFPMELGDLRSRVTNLMEIGCLAVDDEGVGEASFAFAALTREAIMRARERGCQRMVAAVHPRHGKFYERSMGFERLSDPVNYESVQGQLAVCVAGDPGNPAAYKSPWRELFFSGRLEAHRTRLRVMSPADRHYFMNLKLRAQMLPSSRAA